MAITGSDLVRRALQLKQHRLDPHEIGLRLVDIAHDNGHVRVQRIGNGPTPDLVEIMLLDTGEVVYFDGAQWSTIKRSTPALNASP